MKSLFTWKEFPTLWASHSHSGLLLVPSAALPVPFICRTPAARSALGAQREPQSLPQACLSCSRRKRRLISKRSTCLHSSKPFDGILAIPLLHQFPKVGAGTFIWWLDFSSLSVPYSPFSPLLFCNLPSYLGERRRPTSPTRTSRELQFSLLCLAPFLFWSLLICPFRPCIKWDLSEIRGVFSFVCV